MCGQVREERTEKRKRVEDLVGDIAISGFPFPPNAFNKISSL